VQVRSEVGGDWTALQSGGADVAVVANKLTTLPPFTAKDLRIVAAGNEAADRAFIVNLQEDI
jgi:uncharacterized protein YaiI (UPF0178 family)